MSRARSDRAAPTQTLPHERGHEAPRQPVLLGRGHRRDLVVEVTGELVLGRAPPADVVVDDEGVSRRHARILADAEPPRLEDLGSKNGTRLDGERIHLHPLRSGDVIEIGRTQLEYRLATRAELAHARRTAEAWGRLAALTPRELEVARRVAAGATSAQIAEQLRITTRTVTAHLEHVFDRLQIRSRTVLARLVVEARLDDQP